METRLPCFLIKMAANEEAFVLDFALFFIFTIYKTIESETMGWITMCLCTIHCNMFYAWT